MGESLIVRRGGKGSEETAAPTITIISEDSTGVTFTLTNNDDNTAFITFEIDDTLDVIELAAAAVSANITVALAVGTYTLSAFATVVGEVATSATASVEIVVKEYELLFDSLTANNGNPIALPTTEIDITGLSIGKDDTLRLVYTVLQANTGANSFALFVNNNTTTTNYHSQVLLGNGTNLAAFRTNNSTIVYTLQKNSGFVDLKVSNNDRIVYQTNFIRGIGGNSASMEHGVTNTVANFTATEITSLKIRHSATNNIAAGSRIVLYKVTEAA